MSGFTDQMMIQFLDDGFTLDFLSNQVGAQALFEAAYTPEDFTLHSATVSQVVRKEFAAPTFETIRITGSEERITPTSERVRTDSAMKNYGRLVWTEIAVDTIVEAVVQSEEMAPDHIETRALLDELGAVTTLAQLKASLLTRYSQSQVDEVFAKFQISSLAEFKQRMNTFVQFFYKAPPAFDANDPNNEKDFPVSVCLKFQPDLNVFDALQSAKLCREIRARERDFTPVVNGAEVRSPFVFVTVFPASVVVDNAIPNMTASQIKNDVQGLFESEGMIASFFGP